MPTLLGASHVAQSRSRKHETRSGGRLGSQSHASLTARRARFSPCLAVGSYNTLFLSSSAFCGQGGWNEARKKIEAQQIFNFFFAAQEEEMNRQPSYA